MDSASQSRVPVTSGCPPRRPDETPAAYHSRVRIHGWQRFIDDYHNSVHARLPSPHSDYEDEEMESTVRLYQRWIKMETGEIDTWAYEYPVQRAHRLGIPYCNLDTRGKSLSEIDDNEDPLDSVQSMRPEDREWEHALEEMMVNTGTSQAPATSRHKRKRSQDEDSGPQSAAKRLRTATDAETSEAVPHTGHKRKRGQEEPRDLQSQDTSAQEQSSTKKRRIDTDTRQPPASATLGSKRKRVLDEAYDQEPTSFRNQGQSAVKKRRVVKDTEPPRVSASPAAPSTTSNTGHRSRNSRPRITRGASAVVAEDKPPRIVQANFSARVTRAQRQLLSGKDAQLFQLGQRGELDVQGTVDQGGESRDPAGRSERQQRSARSRPRTSAKSERRVSRSGRQNQ